jgi:hypothetical protein
MSYEDQINTDDLFGRFFFRSRSQPASEYSNILELFAHSNYHTALPDWVTGFYVNNSQYGVRFSFFVRKNIESHTYVLFRERSDAIETLIRVAEEPLKRESLSQDYGGNDYELRFRRFLSLQAKIGLEVVKSDAAFARESAIRFRWQAFTISASVRDFWEPVLIKGSNTYGSLAKEQKSEFWDDMARWPNPPQVDWIHLFINLILGFDWSNVLVPMRQSQKKYTDEEINQFLPSEFKLL